MVIIVNRGDYSHERPAYHLRFFAAERPRSTDCSYGGCNRTLCYRIRCRLRPNRDVRWHTVREGGEDYRSGGEHLDGYLASAIEIQVQPCAPDWGHGHVLLGFRGRYIQRSQGRRPRTRGGLLLDHPSDVF